MNMDYTSWILPSAYEWLIPDVLSIELIDEMALKGLFPKLLGLYPAVLFAIGFGILRSFLEVVLFTVCRTIFNFLYNSELYLMICYVQPVAMAALKVTFSNQTPVPDIDKQLKLMKKTTEKFSVRSSPVRILNEVLY